MHSWCTRWMMGSFPPSLAFLSSLTCPSPSLTCLLSVRGGAGGCLHGDVSLALPLRLRLFGRQDGGVELDAGNLTELHRAIGGRADRKQSSILSPRLPRCVQDDAGDRRTNIELIDTVNRIVESHLPTAILRQARYESAAMRYYDTLVTVQMYLAQNTILSHVQY